jgi:transcriptional regulator with XRE-family HTH domain
MLRASVAGTEAIAMAELQQTMGTVIRRERRERGLTLKELAQRAALSVVYLGEIERGKKYPSALVLERLAEALGLDVFELLELVAWEMRAAEQPVTLHPIGFAPTRREIAPSGTLRGHALNMLVA